MLFGGYGSRNRLAQLVLDMDEGRRVRHAEVLVHRREEPWRLIARRLAPLTVEQRQGVCPQRVPRILITRLGRVF